MPTRNKTLIGSTVIWRKIFWMYENMITELCINAFFYDIEAFINEKIGKPPKDKQMIIENLFYCIITLIDAYYLWENLM